VGVLMEQVTLEDFRDYGKFLSREPDLMGRVDMVAAQICFSLAHMGGRPQGKRLSPADFLPIYEHRPKPQKKQTAEQMLATLQMLQASFGPQKPRNQGAIDDGN